jgi:hypothetical protein
MPNNTVAHTQLCRAIRNYIVGQGGYLVKNLGALGQVRGRPDQDGCLKGRYLAIEQKTGRGELSVHQEKQKRLIEDAGGIYIEARSVEDVEDRLVAEGLASRGLF